MMRPPRQRWLLVLVAILLLTNIATLSIYWFNNKPTHNGGPGDHDPANREKRMGQFMVDQLKFDSNQESTYWQLRDSMVTIQRPVMDSIRSAKKRFFDLLNQSGATDSMLAARSNEIAYLQKKLDSVTFRHFQKVRAICRPDQLEKFDTVIKEIVNRMTPFRRFNKQGDSTMNKPEAH